VPSLSATARLRLWRWGAPLGITLIALILRLQNLGTPSTLMFDETFYVKDAWTLGNLGYESKWTDDDSKTVDPDPDIAFNAGHPWGFYPEPSYVAHPPLGKWLIAAGMALFGPSNTFGWRFSVAIAGTVAVLLLFLLAKKLFASHLLGLIAAAFLAIDGHAIVLSRISLLDNFLMLFGLLGVGAILLDRTWLDRRLSAWMTRRPAHSAAPDTEPSGWGPALLWRPWLLAAGLSFGLMCGIKWSGIYFLVGFIAYLIVVDILARRRAGIRFAVVVGLVRQAPLIVLSTVPIAVAAYLATFTGWFISTDGYDRNWIGKGGERWTGPLAWVPDAVQNLWHWHADIYRFHTTLSVPHPYATPAILWPLLARPTQIYYRGSAAGENGCQFNYCSEVVWSIANPILWWSSVAAALFLIYLFIRHRDWRIGLVLAGIGVGYLPWLAYPTRTMFQFYAIVFEPYLLLATVYVIGMLLGIVGPQPPPERRALYRRIVLVFLLVVVAVSAFFYPLWTGMQVPFWFWQLHVWSMTWV